MMDIGFIGLGMMGSRVAARLVNAGHTVRVWNRDRAAVDALARQGARPVASAREAFAGDVVFSMLADDDAVHAVIDPLLDGAPKGLVHVNMATISVALARDLAARHRAAGLVYVAATVFGRPELAAEGKLTIVAAGDSNVTSRVEPLFDVIGQRTWWIGTQPERANVVKLAGNVMLGAAVEAMAEAAAMAWRHGIAPADLLDILTNGVFAAPAYKTYGALIARQQYEPAGFKISLLLKDVRLALAASDAAGAPMPLADLVHESLLEAVARGDGDRDVAALGAVSMRRTGAEDAPKQRTA
ncbi:MAG: 6-phosphogluconate dehydrogenase NAD-binding [Gemmatimonadetes bacterium]|nr:6-phosphogluconate dehydrogenase NAD-binding [Gemmatimonadota bacterium]